MMVSFQRLNSEMNGSPLNNCIDTHDYDGIDNYYSENIESIIVQAVEHQLQLEDMRWQYIVDSALETEVASVPVPTITTAASVLDTSVITTALIPVAPVTTMKMIMNRHRRSRYEQEPQQATATKVNTSSAVTTVLNSI